MLLLLIILLLLSGAGGGLYLGGAHGVSLFTVLLIIALVMLFNGR